MHPASPALSELLGAAGQEDLVAAVERVGAILAAELPPGREGDELPDRVILID